MKMILLIMACCLFTSSQVLGQEAFLGSGRLLPATETRAVSLANPSDLRSIQDATHSKLRAKNESLQLVEVKMRLDSDQKQFKRFDFAYDKEVTLLLNGVIIYYNKRDANGRKAAQYALHKLFDHLYLPLKKGENEVILKGYAHPESVGIRGQWKDLQGLHLK